MNAQKNRTKGFTMLETIVALAVLTATIIGPISLVTRAIFSSSFSRNQLIGYNLAQEGIELVRAIRDNNIHCKDLGTPTAWSNNPALNSPMHDAYTVDINNIVTITCGTSSFKTPKPVNQSQIACDPLYSGAAPIPPLGLDPSGVYTNVSAVQTTGFTRCVKVCSPSNLLPCSAVRDPLILISGDEMEIISIVWWPERNGIQSAVLRDRLYNWE